MVRDPVEMSYLAGFFDGEGSITFNNRPPSMTLIVAVGNTYPAVLMRYALHFGGLVRKDRAKPGKRPMWRWKLSSKKAEAFLEAVFPYLFVKRQQAEIALSFRRRVRHGHGKGWKLSADEISDREYIRERVRSLNCMGRDLGIDDFVGVNVTRSDISRPMTKETT